MKFRLSSLAFIGVFLFLQVPVSFARLGLVAGDISIAPHDELSDGPPYRSWFMYSARPGDIIEDAVDVTNVGKEGTSKKATILATDAGLTTNNGFRLKDSDDVHRYLGKWIQLQKTEVALEAGKDAVVPLTLTIPSTAEEGEYWGGVTIQEKTDQEVGLSTSYRVGARFFLLVDKKLPGVVKRAPRDYPDFNIQKTIGIRDEFNPDVSVPAPAPTSTVTTPPSQPSASSPEASISTPPPDEGLLKNAPSSKSTSPKWTVLSVIVLLILFISSSMFRKNPWWKAIRKKWFVFLFTISLFASSPSVFAGGIGISPNPEENGQTTNRSWFVYNDIEPGKEFEDSVRIINLFEEPVIAVVEAVDGETTKQGGFALSSGDKDKLKIGLWIKLKETTIELQPQESRIIPFTVTVPSTVEVGDHIGGIVVYKSAQKTLAEGVTGFEVQARVGARVYLSVKGERKTSLVVGDIRSEKQGEKYVFHWKFENTGNVRIQPQISIKAENKLGGDPIEIKAPLVAELNPGTSAEVPVDWEKPPAGWYNLAFTVEYGDKKETQSITILNLDTTTMATFSGIGLIVLLLLILTIRSFRRPTTSSS